MMKAKLGTVLLCVIALVTVYPLRADEANARNAAVSPQKTMTREEEKTTNEAAIRELISGFVRAIRAKDTNGVMSAFSPQVVSFDLGPPLQHGGGETFSKRWQELFESYQSPIDYEVRDLSITASDELAFRYSLTGSVER